MDQIKSIRNLDLMSQLKNQNEAMLIGYFVAGDSNFLNAINIIEDSLNAGLDIIELGIPSSDPFLDGTVIKRAHERARFTEEKVDDLTKKTIVNIRNKTAKPIWIMGYKKEVIDSGLYLELAKDKLIDGIILPDMPVNSLKALDEELRNNKIDIIRLVHTEMEQDQLKIAIDGASIIYVQLYKGKTGKSLDNTEGLKSFLKKIQKLTDAPIVAGFGIKDAETVNSVLSNGYDGVVVGTAFVSELEKGNKDSLLNLISQMKTETRKKRQLN